MDKKQKEYSPQLRNINCKWVDLCKIFTMSPIIVKGALNFGLKEVAYALYKNKLIQTYWDPANPCSNGLESMVIFKNLLT